MRDAAGACAYLKDQAASGTTAWANMCESLQRHAYGLPAHYASANEHARAIPQAHRYGHDRPSRGDLVLMVNSTFGHIVTCDPTDAHPWSGWTNDYAGRGRVSRVNDVRDLVRWCGATSWYVADAWWSASNVQHTHNTEDDDMPLTDDDVKRIAAAVWSHDVDPSGGKYSAGGALWTAFQRTAVLNDVAQRVWSAAKRTLTG